MKNILFVLSICLCCSFSVFSQSKKTWEKTLTLNTISGYENFIKEYPEGKYTELAKKFLNEKKNQPALDSIKLKEKRRLIEEKKRLMDLLVEKSKSIKT